MNVRKDIINRVNKYIVTKINSESEVEIKKIKTMTEELIKAYKELIELLSKQASYTAMEFTTFTRMKKIQDRISELESEYSKKNL